MKPPEVDDEVNRDFDILQMRSILDPKRFYKSNDRESLPKYFQVNQIFNGLVFCINSSIIVLKLNSRLKGAYVEYKIALKF